MDYPLRLLLVLLLSLTACLGSDEADDTPTPTEPAPGMPTATAMPTPTLPAPTAPATEAGTSPLDGTAWRLVHMLDVTIDPAWGVTLEFSEGQVSGESGCNAYWAAYTASEPDSFDIGEIASEAEDCPPPLHELNFQERYYDALTVSTRYIQNGRGQLVLQHPNGETLLIFERQVAAARL